MSHPAAPVVLVILDGWGYREDPTANAIARAKTPVMDSLWQAYPHALIQASGRDVGLPVGQMGNSEVGHLNLGAGRVVPQEFVRISDAAAEGEFLHHPVLLEMAERVRVRGGNLHLVGLCSTGGVHSHLDHLLALLDFAKAQGFDQVCVHAITDGRDTLTTSGQEYLGKIQAYLTHLGIGKIATVSGRYYAMDRDKRWERIQQAYGVMTTDGAGKGIGAVELLTASYADGVTDEFIPPVRLTPGAIQTGDGVIFYNFRPDRMRQLVRALVDPKFQGFARTDLHPLEVVTFTEYDPSLAVPMVFAPQSFPHLLGEVVANHGLKQLRAAETEKYAHVTYFFNGGREQPFPGEERLMIPSPQVATYDRAPAMSAQSVTEAVVGALKAKQYDLLIVNYANPDMVGHTGQMEAAITAIETVDKCLGQLLTAASQVGATVLITADHGNAETMRDDQGNPWTAHTTNPVPLIVVEGEGAKIPGHGGEVQLRQGGRLADIAPTILQILGLPQPPEMTGQSLIVPAAYEVIPERELTAGKTN
ncbi:phosphoglyceromutase [Gloeomargarita lithophora Alchichica-D10]|uniref:2,3-bisphosphoglycerate-independent phosphoglycerate mutase n=1 Tax=Gloeomargarita lithophora Alchichica-D10 TaxID=1188229 RepID=A0A1J0AD94_9CYAN|nr:2,3-bisphosphoglycerate-independent phosphoglycerate mutase [Gloeomargarita lithophora]APB33880.1 phosphoglyceromutase [Gloeomargarita lithophora Alchichica-D10]